MKNNRKGSATVYLIIALLVMIVIAALIIKLNWKRFTADASFGFAVAGIIIVILQIMFLMIRHSIRKAKKERALKKAAKEAAKAKEKA